MKITCRPSCAVISKIMSTVTDSPIFQQRTQAQQDDRPSHSSQQHREGSVADKKKSGSEVSEISTRRFRISDTSTWLSANLGCFLRVGSDLPKHSDLLIKPYFGCSPATTKISTGDRCAVTSRHKKGTSLYEAFTSTSQLHQTQTIHCCFHQTIVPAIAASPNTLRIKNTNDQHCHGLNQRASGSISSQSCHSFLFFFYH
jgi:hypothetical protein